MNIIWGYKAEPHITAQQLRNTYIGIFGEGIHILDVGSNLAATVISATEVQIADGVMVAQGCTASIEYGVTESLTITNGSQGMLRKDLIVAQYTKNSGTGVESMGLAVKTGTPAASNPATPAYTTGSIAEGDTLVEFPLYVVNLDGITIESIEMIADVVNIKDSIDSLDERMDTAESNIIALQTLTTKQTATPQTYTDGITVDSTETSLTKRSGFVECKLRFTVTASQDLPANKQLFLIPSGFRPAKVIRPIVHDWNLGQPRRFNVFTTGEISTVDTLPTGLQFIMTFVYAV